MFKLNYPLVILGTGILMLACSTLFAQLAYSPFTEGSVAYVAMTGSEINFARGNPAALAHSLNMKKVIYSIENNQDHLDSHIQNFGLRVAVNSRLTISVGRWYHIATTGAIVSSARWGDPLYRTGFGYHQDWTVGVGLKANQNLAFGISIRNEEYSATPSSRQLEVTEEYWTSDIGMSYSIGQLGLGIILRNVVQDHNLDPAALQITKRLADGSLFSWNPTDIQGLAFEPEFNVEMGASWKVKSYFELLGDISTRSEYAVGVQISPISNVLITAGGGQRYDHIYDNAVVQYAATGLQIRFKMLAIATVWIVPLRPGRNQFIDTKYGSFEEQQITNHQLLVGMALAY